MWSHEVAISNYFSMIIAQPILLPGHDASLASQGNKSVVGRAIAPPCFGGEREYVAWMYQSIPSRMPTPSLLESHIPRFLGCGTIPVKIFRQYLKGLGFTKTTLYRWLEQANTLGLISRQDAYCRLASWQDRAALAGVSTSCCFLWSGNTLTDWLTFMIGV